MQDAMAAVLKSNVDKLVQASPFFSLLIDESTDVSNHENLVVYVKLLNDCKPELHFLENINVRDGKAKTITTAIKMLMEKRNLDKNKMTGFGSDGASVMTGKNNGVAKRMKDNSPYLISIHCMAHRLALCTSQAANGIPYLSKFKETLTALYRYFDKSALRSQSLTEFQKIFQEAELKIKEVFDIWWFSFYGALETLYRTWQPLVAYMESCPNKDDKARGFQKTLKEFKFVATLSLMMDVIPILTFMSLALQKEHVELSSVQAMVVSTISQITALKSKNGKFLSDIMPSEKDVTEIKWKDNTIKVNPHEVQQFETVKGKFLDNILLNLQQRFPIESTDVVNAFVILSLRNVRFQGGDLSTYGNEELETLLSHYGSAKETKSGEVVPAIVNAENCRIEWNFAKELVVREHYPVGQIAELWKLMATHHRDEVQNLIKLSQLALVLPTKYSRLRERFQCTKPH